MLLVFLWLTAIAIVSTGQLLPDGSGLLAWISVSGLSDKVLHFTAYFVLALIPSLGFPRRTALSAALAMIPLGALLDTLQLYVPGRSFELADILTNAAGVLTAILTAQAIAEVRNQPVGHPPE